MSIKGRECILTHGVTRVRDAACGDNCGSDMLAWARRAAHENVLMGFFPSWGFRRRQKHFHLRQRLRRTGWRTRRAVPKKRPGRNSFCFVENIILVRNVKVLKIDNVRPHPGPMGGAPSACKSVPRARDCRSRDTQTQARHESVPRNKTFASRNVVPQERVKGRPSSNDRISFLQSKRLLVNHWSLNCNLWIRQISCFSNVE
jgi:hypothetical protein